jgi:hypothetical protein
MSTTTPRGMTPKADRTGPMKAATGIVRIAYDPGFSGLEGRRER